MAFEGISARLQSVFKKLSGRGKLSEKDVRDAMREIRLALLEADVNFLVAKDFVKTVTERAVGAEVLESLTPGQQVVKIVNEELTRLMGGGSARLEFGSAKPAVFLLAGLQGAGKTTLCGKLAVLLKKQYGKTREEIEAKLSEEFSRNYERDIRLGFTGSGPHRDDLKILIGGTEARVYGSQGQARTAALALKLAETEIFKRLSGESPVLILDDVMSELDLSRQDYILNHIHDWQVFITCCDPGAVRRLDGGRAFRMQDGILTPDG